ncbi:MAG: hypothetical protein DA328_01305 [Nitrososphaeraceae archaeon]|nr:hypothetical protein [Nitrososphaeraceae archaeon]
MNTKYLTVNAIVLTAVLSIIVLSTTAYYAYANEEPNVDVDAEIEQEQDCDGIKGGTAACAASATVAINIGQSPP